MKLPDDAREFFRKAGSKGGRRTAKKLSASQRSENARRAVQARWAKAKAEKPKAKRK